MAIPATVIAAGGARAWWGYNRENYMYDRTQRQKTEFQIFMFKKAQAAMWREDVRDITELTEKKMDNYLIVNTLMLGMCLGLFAEGRLDKDTPPWLLHFYMLTLGAAFMYLLLSIWLAIHASIIAQCSSVRILTQFVRLPVPTWDELEETRTYGNSFEALGARRMFRIPFLGRRESAYPSRPGCRKEDGGTAPGTGTSSPMGGIPSFRSEAYGRSAGSEIRRRRSWSASSWSSVRDTIDPWDLENTGENRDLYELQAMPAALRRHIGLARRAAMQYQCFDAFARVSMAFGTNQLLHAICYCCLGYVAHHSGSPWPAWCAVSIMMCIALLLVWLDFSLSTCDRAMAGVLLSGGPICAAAAIMVCALAGHRNEVMFLACAAYGLHACWLLFFLSMCGIEMQANGAELPMKIRAVLYLDVFGWLAHHRAPGRPQPFHDPLLGDGQDGLFRQYSHSELNEIELSPHSRASARRPKLRKRVSASGEEFEAPANAFAASTYAPAAAAAVEKHGVENDMDQPGKAPSRLFQRATMILVNLWVFGSAVPFWGLWEHMKTPMHPPPLHPEAHYWNPTELAHRLGNLGHHNPIAARKQPAYHHHYGVEVVLAAAAVTGFGLPAVRAVRAQRANRVALHIPRVRRRSV